MTDEKKELIKAYKRLFNSPDGEIVLKDLSRNIGIDRSTYEIGSRNVEDMLYREGGRSLYLYIKGNVEQVIKENTNTNKNGNRNTISN